MEDFKNILEKYRFKKYLFLGYPQQLVRSDYQKARDEVIFKISKNKDVCSIYSLTGGGMPGISDLDLMIVLDNDFENSSGKDYHRKNFSPVAQYTLDHVLQRKDLFSKLYYRYHYRWAVKTNTLRCLYGKEVKPEEISDRELYLSKVYYLAGIFFTKMARDFLRSLTVRRLNIKGLLRVIYTLKFSVILENQITGISSQNSWLEFSKQFDEFRQRWFEMGKNRYQKLIDSLIEATNISCQLVEEFSNFLREKNLIPNWPNPENKKFLGLFTGYKFYTIFYDSRFLSPKQALKLNFDLNEKKRLRVLLFPSEFATYLWQLSQASQGERSKYISENLFLLKKKPQVLAPKEISCREKLLNQYIDFLLKGNALVADLGGVQLYGFYSGSDWKDKLIEKIRNSRSQLIKSRMLKYLNQQNKEI